MAALSTFYSNWDSSPPSSLQYLNTDITCSFHQQQPQLSGELFGLNNNNFEFAVADTTNFMDQQLWLESSDNDNHDPNSYTNLFPAYDHHNHNLISLSPEIIPLLEDNSESYQSSKRLHFTNNMFCQYHLPNFPRPQPEVLPIAAHPEIEVAPGSVTFNQGRSDDQNAKKSSTGGVSLSMQSIAARERRRKITAKTQELGKLIPGGHRMNTAEMFQAAYKYVKFLQAQVKMLQIMHMQERREEMTILLESPIIQEKLYSYEKCLVLKEFVETLANDSEIPSKPLVYEGIHQLLETNIG